MGMSPQLDSPPRQWQHCKAQPHAEFVSLVDGLPFFPVKLIGEVAAPLLGSEINHGAGGQVLRENPS